MIIEELSAIAGATKAGLDLVETLLIRHGITMGHVANIKSQLPLPPVVPPDPDATQKLPATEG